MKDIIFGVGGGTGVVGLIVAFFKSTKVKSVFTKLTSQSAVTDLTEALSTLRTVVETQGESIEWLRGELTATKDELMSAREQLKNTEALSIENSQLRIRIADLEEHVAKLQEELNKRRGGRPKKVIEGE
jgi:predicted nuclease with TOPRIM domain